MFLHRPSSPSSNMRALSKKLAKTGIHDDLPLGTPPARDDRHHLWQNVDEGIYPTQGKTSGPTRHSNPPSDVSTFSFMGDPLPDEVYQPAAPFLDARVEGDAFIALRDLAVLVARRQGMKIDTFLPKLLELLSGREEAYAVPVPEVRTETTISKQDYGSDGFGDWTHDRRLRHFRSQPHLSSDQIRRRHFSFVPGDDQGTECLGQRPLDAYSSNPEMPSDVETPRPENTPSPLSIDVRKHSKIPSPVHASVMARVRRGNSPSSMLAAVNQDDDRRRDSTTSSIITAVRQNSNKSSRPVSNRSSLQSAGRTGSQRMIERQTSLRNNTVALAAARAAGKGVQRSPGNDERSPNPKRTSKQSSRSGSSVTQAHPTRSRRSQSENKHPNTQDITDSSAVVDKK